MTIIQCDNSYDDVTNKTQAGKNTFYLGRGLEKWGELGKV